MRNLAKSKAIGLMCLAVGLVIRLAPWQSVFTPDGIRFFTIDPYYHVLRAQRIVQDYPRVPWVDPMMNYPEGAPIIWPVDMTSSALLSIAHVIVALPALLPMPSTTISVSHSPR